MSRSRLWHPISEVAVTYPWPDVVHFAEGVIAGACWMLLALHMTGHLA